MCITSRAREGSKVVLFQDKAPKKMAYMKGKMYVYYTLLCIVLLKQDVDRGISVYVHAESELQLHGEMEINGSTFKSIQMV